MYSYQAAIVLSAVDFALCVVLALLRFYSRISIVKSFWWDDWFAVAALIVRAINEPIILLGYIKGGFGHPPAGTGLGTLVLGLKYLYFFEVTYLLGTCFIKISFGLTLLRFLRQRMHIWICRAIIALVVAVTIAIELIVIFHCTPVDYFWNQLNDPFVLAGSEGENPFALGLKPGGKCTTNPMTATYTHVTTMLIADLTLGILLPVLLLKDLRLKTELKIMSGMLLALGAIPSIGSVARLVYAPQLNKSDSLYTGMPNFVWADIEFSWCIIATSLATLKPLLIHTKIITDPANPPSSYPSGGGSGAKSRKLKSQGWINTDRDAEMDTMTGTAWSENNGTAVNDGKNDSRAAILGYEGDGTEIGINKSVEVRTTFS